MSRISMNSYNSSHSASKGRGWHERQIYMPSVDRRLAHLHRKAALKGSPSHDVYTSTALAQNKKNKTSSKQSQLANRSILSRRVGCRAGEKEDVPEARIVRQKDLAGMPPMVARVGGKTKLKKTLREHVPPHDTYVEPFVGGGTLYWDKPLVKKNVINDADPALAKFYKDVKTEPAANIKSCHLPTNKKEFEVAKDQRNPDGTFDDSCEYLRVVKRSYGGKGESFNMPPQENRPNAKKFKSTSRITKIKSNADMYKEKLGKTTVTNDDFCTVMKKHDSKDTFHYLDPPYWDTHHQYDLPKVNPKDVAKCASEMKGDVLVSYDNHPDVKKAFKGWKAEKHKTKYEMQTSNEGQRGVKKDVTELMLMNYDPNTGKRIKVPRVAS